MAGDQTGGPGFHSKIPGPSRDQHAQFGDPGTVNAQEQGLMGLGMNKLSFFPTLCAQGVVDECRYGLAFGLDGTGTAILGSKDQDLYEGELSVQKTGQDWDMTNKLMVDGTEILAESDTVVLDSGTVNVIVPTVVARKLFTALNIQIVEQTLPGCTNSIFGYYPCDKPPTVGFQFGDKVFNIESSRFQLEDNGNNNCTAIITGIDVTEKHPNLWLIGQAWMQGKYVDFRKKDDGYEIGVANLKNPGSGCP
ncbi:unnamed protein product [Zymoseptoria tritici ST99CH_3D7]|uniref:Peptidase A1 domain-containing protein n=1 Tax=Zymoseptoria tritici (strain ST99CH_3D7) TaxID=1276538 RepID=A0A1X7S2C7_ZYMT9|nr:unnamed protein product [Zymoseptoria tritici ST99CH_3D7]